MSGLKSFFGRYCLDSFLSEAKNINHAKSDLTHMGSNVTNHLITWKTKLSSGMEILWPYFVSYHVVGQLGW